MQGHRAQHPRLPENEADEEKRPEAPLFTVCPLRHTNLSATDGKGRVPQDMGTNGLRASPQMEGGTDGQTDDRHTAYADSRVCRTTRSKLVPTLEHTQQPAALNAVLQGWKTTRAHIH